MTHPKGNAPGRTTRGAQGSAATTSTNTTGAAYQRVLDAFRNQGCIVDDRGTTAAVQAPGHSAADRSVSVTAIDGSVLVYSHSEPTNDVLAAVGLTLADLYDNPRGATYRYPDGRTVHRTPAKKFRQSGNTKGRSLFHADKVADATTVYYVEGEKDVLAVEAAGGAAVCNAQGAGKAHLADLTPLTGKTVVVVADKDGPGHRHATQVMAALNAVAATTTAVQAAVGKDAADHIAAGKTLAELVPAELPTADVADDHQPGGATNPAPEARKSAATQLVELARERYDLGMSDKDEPYGVSKSTPHIAMLLRAGRAGLRAELSRRYFEECGTTPPQQAIADALSVLEGQAAQHDSTRLHLRVAEHDRQVFIDTGDTAGTVIRIGNGTWELTDTAPVVFERTKLTGAIRRPDHDGDLTALWEFVNVDVADRPVLLAWLVASLIAEDIPHPVLALLAEHGSAKSSSTRALVELVDPSPVPLRQAPRDADAWTTAAAGSWVVALDNLSSIPAWLSDSLCRASTGDGQVKRALYTDGDLAVIKFRRCVIFNGIDVGALRGDLADRLAAVDLKRIDPTTRRSESDLAARWESARAGILGGLLTLAALVHQRLANVELDEAPRMADFARILAAVDQVMSTAGYARYVDRAGRLAEESLSDDEFVSVMRAHRYCVEQQTAKTIHAEVSTMASGGDVKWRQPKDWPKTPRAVTGLLKRHAPALRATGWQIDDDGGRNKDKVTRWTITPPDPNPDDDPIAESSADSRPPRPRDPSPQVRDENSAGQREIVNPPTAAVNPPTAPAHDLAGYRDGVAGQGISDNPPENTSLTSKDGVGGYGGHKSAYLSANDSADERTQCGRPDCADPLTFTDDQRDGYHTSNAKCLAWRKANPHAIAGAAR